MKIDISKRTKELHFPVIKAIPMVRTGNLFQRMWKFLTFRRRFEVMEDYILFVPDFHIWIFIPKGFIFDGASVPKIMNNIYSSTGTLFLGALPHDFGYRYEGLMLIDIHGNPFFKSYDKAELDNIFFILNSYESQMPKTAAIAEFTLCLFGFLGWRENRKKNAVLADDFPELFLPSF